MRTVPYILRNTYGCTAFIVFIALVYCILSNTEYQSQAVQEDLFSGPRCRPILSEGCHSYPVVGGYISIECEISSCYNVTRVIYEKYIDHWTHVFEGVSKTEYRALDSDEYVYSLKLRYEYTAFYSQHILYIKPVILDDKGDWRCVAYNMDGKIGVSQFLDIVITSPCKPILSVGSHDKLIEGGHSSIECEISTCSRVSMIIYEKTGVHHQPVQWTAVFEGTNKTVYKDLNTKTNYSLANRTEYTAFYSRHILYIQPLITPDQGEWRCVVHDHNNKRHESKPLHFYMDVLCKPQISEGSHSKLELEGYTSLECEITDCVNVENITFEKKGIFELNKWTKVFEGRSKNDYHALDSGFEYSLSNRTEYAVFYSRHILYIKSLIYEDQGEWRCVVHDRSYRQSKSQPINLHLAKSCKPVISEGSFNKLAIEGHTSLECEYHTCVNVSKVVYEKSDIDQTESWTPVFEGTNKTVYRPLDTGTQYSLENRNEYTAFYTEHILYIRPLISEDQGEWRCSVYEQNNVASVPSVKTITLQLSVESRPSTMYHPTLPTSSTPTTKIPDPYVTHATYSSYSDYKYYIVFVICGLIIILYIIRLCDYHRRQKVIKPRLKEY